MKRPRLPFVRPPCPAVLVAIGVLLGASAAGPARAADAPATVAASTVAAATESATTGAAGTAPDKPESARAILAKWMETERIIAQERSEWQHSRDMLRARIDLVNGEIQAQQEKMKQLRATGSELGAKRATLDSDDQAARSTLEALSGWIGTIETGVRALSARFPQPLIERIKPLVDRMPADPANTKITMAERFQNVVGILNEANKFDNDITMNAEIRKLSDGTPSEVRVVYLGLGQAYFVSANGEAGVGRPGPDGWTWSIDRGIAAKVAQVVEILLAKSKPKLVPLPVSLQ